MREEATIYGTRVHYAASEVPGVLGEAQEMFWQPFARWRARLRINPFSSRPRYLLDFRVRGNLVFDGGHDDVARLLAAFQCFLDDNRDRVDRPRSECRRYGRHWT